MATQKKGVEWSQNREAQGLQQLSRMQGNEVDGPANLSCDTTPSEQANEVNVTLPTIQPMVARKISGAPGKSW